MTSATPPSTKMVQKFKTGDKICHSYNKSDKSAHYDVVALNLVDGRYVLKPPTESADHYYALWLAFDEDDRWVLREESIVDRILTKYSE